MAQGSPKSSGIPASGFPSTVAAVKKARIDAVLADRGLFPSRTAAAGAVRAGAVRVGGDGPVALRPSQLVEPDAELVVDSGPRFVSRGGIKLDNALSALGIEVAGRDCLDVGASTGGFTDCLLQRGAARVIALDVAYGQIDLRSARGSAGDRDRAPQRPRASSPPTCRSCPTWRRSTSRSSR